MNNYKKYLPSKKFVAILLIIVVFIAMFFTIKGVVSLFKSNNGAKGNGQPTTMIVGDLIQKDTNYNGIADWEEYLWGLDPTKNGPENKEFITSKKAALVKSGDIIPNDDSKTITDNELLSQEFFATIVSLQQTGQLDDASMKSISESIGKNVDTTPIPDIYTSKMLTIESDSTLANTNYRNALSSLVTKYTDANIGSELTFIVQGMSNNDPQALYAAKTVGGAYQSFGKDMMSIPVPQSLSVLHLSVANNYEKVGQSINGLTLILTDQLVGMKSIINYKNYSDALASDLEKISGALQ